MGMKNSALSLSLPPQKSTNKVYFQVPKNSCDCHAHILGPSKIFPYIHNRSYTPPDASIESYKLLHRDLNFERAVIVQPSVYGTDNRVTIEAVKQYGSNARGVVVINNSISDAELEKMHQCGIRGVRLNLLFKGGTTVEDIRSLADRLQSLKWHIQILMDVSSIEEISPLIESSKIPLVFDHMGHMNTQQGLEHSGFETLIRLLKDRRAWVKLSGNYRVSAAGFPYHDVIPFAQRLIEAAPTQALWGSDWPHPGLKKSMPNDGDLLNDLDSFAPDETQKKAILVENPETLYGFR